MAISRVLNAAGDVRRTTALSQGASVTTPTGAAAPKNQPTARSK
jgi:hypothetical protein